MCVGERVVLTNGLYREIFDLILLSFGLILMKQKFNTEV